MNVILRSDQMPDVGVVQVTWEYCNIEQLEQHIRTLQTARKWLVEEKRRKDRATK